MQIRRGLNQNRIPPWIVAAAFVVAVLPAATAWPQSSPDSGGPVMATPLAEMAPLDGRQFSASIVRDDADEDEADRPLGDQLFFSDGMFSSAICKRYNFTDAPYWVRVEGDQIHFLAEMTSPTDGRMLWKGTIRGETLEGTMRWTKKRWYWTIDTEHKIRGKLDTGPSAASLPAN